MDYNVPQKLIATNASPAVVLIRLMVGAVFLSEGIQKFINPAANGAGRFAKIGLPAPETPAPLVGTFEMVCGALVLLGLLPRLVAVPLLVIVLTAILSTKIPELEYDSKKFYQITAARILKKQQEFE